MCAKGSKRKKSYKITKNYSALIKVGIMVMSSWSNEAMLLMEYLISLYYHIYPFLRDAFLNLFVNRDILFPFPVTNKQKYERSTSEIE